MSRILFGAIGVAAAVAGWNAWTGRWRSWAHPYSGKGLLPLALLPVGLMMMVGVFADPTRGELAGWQLAILVPVVLPATVALVTVTITAFYTPRRFPAFLRPRWLPPDWKPPMFVDARAVAIRSRFGPALHPSSTEVAAQAANGVPPLERWHAHYEEEDPAVPYLNLGLVGLRWCEITIYHRLVTIAQTVPEDRLHERHFVITLTPADVRAITFVPAERMSWRSMRRRTQFPRLIIETTSQVHRLAFQPRFGRSMASRLRTLEGVLEVTATR